MIWFEYSYNKPSVIIDKMKLLWELWIIEYWILFIIIIMFLLLIYYIVPYFHFLFLKIYDDKLNKKKKKLINLIIMQKDIEEEIEKELNLK